MVGEEADMTRLSARTVMITGGVSGLGLAMASAFAETGAHLFVGGQMSEKEAADIPVSYTHLTLPTTRHG